MEISRDDLLTILKIVQETEVGYLELQAGDLRIVLSKDSLVPAHSAAAAPNPAGAAPAATVPYPAPASPPGPAAADLPPGRAPQPPDDAGLLAIPSPMVGVFYSRPEPGAKPFVQVGDVVETETTVGLIEVMKVFNAAKARVAGRIERSLVEDGQFVEFGQTLFLVRPSDG